MQQSCIASSFINWHLFDFQEEAFASSCLIVVTPMTLPWLNWGGGAEPGWLVSPASPCSRNRATWHKWKRRFSAVGGRRWAEGTSGANWRVQWRVRSYHISQPLWKNGPALSLVRGRTDHLPWDVTQGRCGWHCIWNWVDHDNHRNEGHVTPPFRDEEVRGGIENQVTAYSETTRWAIATLYWNLRNLCRLVTRDQRQLWETE